MSFWLSSIVNEAIKTISSQFTFFTKRNQNSKETISTLLELFMRAKNCWLCCFLFAYFCLCWLVLVDLRFSTSKSFLLKKVINWLKIVLIASFTILLASPVDPIWENLQCVVYVFQQMFIANDLWKCYLFHSLSVSHGILACHQQQCHPYHLQYNTSAIFCEATSSYKHVIHFTHNSRRRSRRSMDIFSS